MSPEQLLGTVDFGEAVVVADFEAGINTIVRLGGEAVDVMLVVVEPTLRSIEVGQRAVALARQRDIDRVIVVASRVTDDADVARISAAFDRCELAVVPHDEAIVDAERLGVAPLDAAPDAPAVTALLALGKSLAASVA